MTKRKILRPAILGIAATLVIGCVGYIAHAGPTASAATTPPASDSTFRGFTNPSEDSNLVFGGPGVIKDVVVKPGKVVKAGETLASQDTAEEVAKLNIAKLLAESTKEIQAAQADLESKQVDLLRIEDANSDILKQNKSNSEVDAARVAVKIAKIVVDFRKESKEKAGLDLAQQQVMVDKKKLISPIDGIVAKVDIHPGDGVDLTKPAVEIVQIDPLWIEVDIPSSRTRQLKVNQQLLVRYADEDSWQKANIIFLTPYADAGAQQAARSLDDEQPHWPRGGLAGRGASAGQ